MFNWLKSLFGSNTVKAAQPAPVVDTAKLTEDLMSKAKAKPAKTQAKLEGMTKKELVAFGAATGVKLKMSMKKQEMLDALK